MTLLRKRMLEELQRRRYSPETIRLYLSAVKHFTSYFGKRPDHLGSEDLLQYQLYLDPIPVGQRFGANHRTLSRLQTEISRSV